MKWEELSIDEQIKRSKLLFGNGIKVIVWDENVLRFFVNHYKAKTIDIAVSRALEDYAKLLKSHKQARVKNTEGITTSKSIGI